MIDAAPALQRAVETQIGRPESLEELEIFVVGFYPPDEVLIDCRYALRDSDNLDEGFAVMHFGLENGRWVYHPENLNWALGKALFLLRRPDLPLFRYLERLKGTDEFLERRRCSRNSRHAFWTYGYLYCPYDGGQMSDVLERVSTRDTVIRRGALWRNGKRVVDLSFGSVSKE